MLRGKRKIKAPRRGITGTSLDPYDLEADVSTICSLVRLVLAERGVEKSFEEYYRVIMRVVTRKKGEILNDRVHNVLEEWLSKEAKPNIKRLASACHAIEATSDIDCPTRIASQNFLVELKNIWRGYYLASSMLSDVFMYMDRILAAFGRASFSATSKTLFCKYILQTRIEKQGKHDLTVQEVLKNIVLKQIELDRNGDIIDRNLIKSCVDLLLDISEDSSGIPGDKMYISILESDFLQISQEFYRTERSAWMSNSAASAYFRQLKNRISEEQDLCRSIFPESTTVKLLKILGEELTLVEI